MQVPPQIVRLFIEIQRPAVIVTAVRVTAVRVIIGYSERFLLPKKDLLILKIFGYCDSRC